MKNLIGVAIRTVAKPFIGKGYIDRYFPFLIVWYQFFYTRSQKEEIKEVDIPLDLKMLVFTRDIGVGLPLILNGKFEPTQTAHFLDQIRGDDVFFDIGSHVGYYALLAGKSAPDSKVFAFEPDPQTYEILTKNIKNNSLSNILPIEKAVSNTSGDLFFKSEKSNKGESALSLDDNGQKVKAVSLDEFTREAKIPKVTLINMDIEGAETMALAGAQRTLKENKIRMYIEYNPSSIKKLGLDPSAFIAQIEALGFNIEAIIDESREMVIPYSTDTLASVMKHTTYCNLFCKK